MRRKRWAFSALFWGSEGGEEEDGKRRKKETENFTIHKMENGGSM